MLHLCNDPKVSRIRNGGFEIPFFDDKVNEYYLLIFTRVLQYYAKFWSNIFGYLES